MQTAECLISFVVLFSLSGMVIDLDEPEINDSLYGYQIAGDVWRVLWLRGGLKDFDKRMLQDDVEIISEITGLEISFDEEDVASYRGGKDVSVLKKSVVINGKPRVLTVRISKI